MKTFWYDSIDSTNTVAFRRLPDLPSLCVLAARDQTAGRGQRGNTWFTQPGKNLTFSIVVKFGEGSIPPLAAQDALWLNYLISNVLACFLDQEGVRSEIKWPNDIYVQRRKLSGVLIENTLSGENLQAAVIGVGLNVNQREFPQLANATSLCRVLGRELSVEDSLNTICRLFEEALPSLFDPELRAGLFSAYSGRLFQKGIPAHYSDFLIGQEFTGVIEGVEADGRLCIKDSEGRRRFYRFKEVGYIL